MFPNKYGKVKRNRYVILDRDIKKNRASFEVTDNDFIYFDLCIVFPGISSTSGMFVYHNYYAVCCTQFFCVKPR